jgi:type IV pilus assembly protein PilV
VLTEKMMPMNLSDRGFTLLEVLVALVVLSIGLLGLAGLQLTSVTNTRDAYYRTQAIALSYDIADRMRANLNRIADYDANTTTTPVAACRTTGGCINDTDMANDDLALWRQSVAALPGGEGIVCIDSTPNDGTSVAAAACDASGDQYVVKVWWNNDRDAANANELLTTVFVP